MEKIVTLAYVRYVGTKVCWTLEDGRFWMAECEELSCAERDVCEAGGGYVEVSPLMKLIAL